jgi:hypothetical protein
VIFALALMFAVVLIAALQHEVLAYRIQKECRHFSCSLSRLLIFKQFLSSNVMGTYFGNLEEPNWL